MKNFNSKTLIRVDKENLQRSLSTMSTLFRKGSIEKQAPLAIKCEDYKLQSFATDGAVYIKTILPIEEPPIHDELYVDGLMFNKFIKTLGRGYINIYNDEEFIYAKQGKSTLKIPIRNQEPYKNFLTTENMIEVNISCHNFIKGINKVVHACAKESHISATHAVYFAVYEDGNFAFVATDSKRLACYSESPINHDLKPLYISLIPKEAANEITKIFSKIDFKIFVRLMPFDDQINDGNVYTECVGIVSEHCEFITRTITGDFPEHSSLITIDKSNRVYLSLDKEALSTRLNQVLACSETVHMIINAEGITFKSLDGNNGSEIEVLIDYPQEIQEESELKIRISYLLDCFGSIDSKRLLLILNEPGKPIAIQENFDEDPFSKVTVVMMPIGD